MPAKKPTAKEGPAKKAIAKKAPAMPSVDALPRIGKPATRALASIGVTKASQLANHTEAELLALHGFGPRAIRILADAKVNLKR